MWISRECVRWPSDRRGCPRRCSPGRKDLCVGWSARCRADSSAGAWRKSSQDFTPVWNASTSFPVSRRGPNHFQRAQRELRELLEVAGQHRLERLDLRQRGFSLVRALAGPALASCPERTSRTGGTLVVDAFFMGQPIIPSAMTTDLAPAWVMNASSSSATRMSSRMAVWSFESQHRRSFASASSPGKMPTVSLVAMVSSGP